VILFFSVSCLLSLQGLPEQVEMDHYCKIYGRQISKRTDLRRYYDLFPVNVCWILPEGHKGN
jgi:hypothetical protein